MSFRKDFFLLSNCYGFVSIVLVLDGDDDDDDEDIHISLGYVRNR